MASASVDVVTAISLFGVFLGLAFSEGKWNPVITVNDILTVYMKGFI